MRKDAFDDVVCPFDYSAELNRAREALNEKIGMYVSENERKGYRELAKRFLISPAALCAIAKKYSRKRKPGRHRGRRISFDVRDRMDGKDREKQVIVITRQRGVSIEMMRHMIVGYFPKADVSVSRTTKAGRQEEYDYDEIQALNTPIQYMRKGASEIETDLRTLDGCIQQALASESGEIAFESVTRWLAAHRAGPDGMYNRAHRMAAQYAELRES